jgi:predicted nucleotidyltransferase component of viral defense system
VREYATPAGFRAAVEARLRERARRLGVPAYIVRRQAALERLVVRLSKVAPGRWAVKGGFALETRLGERARASMDLDADHRHGAGAARADLQRASIEETRDHFAFAVLGTEELFEAGVRLALRYRLESTLAARVFEPLQVDVSFAPPEPWDAEPAQRPGVLAEFGLKPIEMLLVPVERQVAEKLHAYTRRYKGRGTTRARDLVDLLLIRQYERMEAAALKDAIKRVFARRQTHAVPTRLSPPPRELALSYKREAERVGVNPVLAEAHQLVADWLVPLFDEIERTDGV